MRLASLKLNLNQIFFLSFTLALLIAACNKDDTPTPVVGVCNNTNYTYTNEIKAIFDAKCATASCHNGNNSLADYSNYAGVYNDRDKLRDGISQCLNAIINGRANISRAEIDKISCWIRDGAPE